jgi:hypothetical protein
MPTQTDDLFEYAYLGDVAANIDWLANLAASEDWEYHHVTPDPSRPPRISHPALVNYLRYTFKRLREEGKVVEQGDSAAFNTGLLTPLQEEIFAIFEPNEHTGRQPWFLQGFAQESDRRLAGFQTLPERAQYFDDPAELLYDFRRPLRKNLNHIIDENRDRFPEPYRSDPETHRLLIALEGAIDHALKRVRQNYKTAVPQFYWPRGATRGQLQLLLPLCLTSPSQVDIALTVYHEGNSYLASTVLTLEMAYNNARLIARPHSDWLTP